MRAALCVMLSGALLLSQSGCWRPIERAKSWRAQVKTGMSEKEVLRVLGPPDKIIKDETGVVWKYRYKGGSGFGYWVGVISLTLLIIPLLILARGGSTGNIYGTPGAFRIHLKDGVLDWITPVEPDR